MPKVRRLVSRVTASLARVAPYLLPHVSLLLAVVVGAGLATDARLKWDPSTYIVIRKLFPLEYRVAAVSLCVLSFTLTALGHLAVLALAVSLQSKRRAMLLTYAGVMSVVMCAEVAWAAWTVVRLAVWLRAQDNALQAMPDLMQWLQVIRSLLPDQIQHLIQEVTDEVTDDVPRNLYVGVAAVVLVGVLQPVAVLLAILSARHQPSTAPSLSRHAISCRSTDDVKPPLKFIFRKVSVPQLKFTYNSKTPAPAPPSHIYINSKFSI